VRPVCTFNVVPSIPDRLRPLVQLAYNLRWTWDHDTIALFRRMDPDLWETTGHNPVAMLGTISQRQLEELAQDEGFLLHMERVNEQLSDFMSAPTWYGKQFGEVSKATIAYFSAEHGITECVQIYSGGLGILAGDVLKAASELGLPLVGVGLMYQVGYFRQILNAEGWQGELYPVHDFYRMPCRLARRPDGVRATVSVPLAGRMVAAQIWEVQVGRIMLHLLDTNIEENTPTDRAITGELYGGDIETRIQQEIVLGIGGVRALHQLDIHPTVYHMNEGHSAFLALERIRHCMEEEKVPFAVAAEATKAGNVFTTHTPVPAGIDVYPPQLMDKYFSQYYSALGILRKEFLGLGRQNPDDDHESFSMAVLAFRMAACANGVSRLHGQVSRKMWQSLWPGVPQKEIPISHVTNGVYPRGWISEEIAELFDRYLGRRWVENPADQGIWERINRIPAEELWRTHERRRERLVTFARRRLRQQLMRRSATRAEIDGADEVLNPSTLTIGFARRFATYKRADLLLHNPDRLARIVGNKERPVQIIFSGKSHPKDNLGKELIRQLVKLASREEFRRHIVFIEDYDMAVCRYLVQGVDLWLNTPRRLYEASGTSGMKAAFNGALNMSILDGWWDEAYQPAIGWAIGRGEEYEYDDLEHQYEVESSILYNLIEEEVAPLFYDRGGGGLPRRWIEYMFASMRAICPAFNTNRVVHEYLMRFYRPADERYRLLIENEGQQAKEMVGWKEQLRKNWSQIRIERAFTKMPREMKVGMPLEVETHVHLGKISPENVCIQAYIGPLDRDGQIVDGEAVSLTQQQAKGDDLYAFSGNVPCRETGLHGCAVRIVPKYKGLCNPFEPGLILWSK